MLYITMCVIPIVMSITCRNSGALEQLLNEEKLLSPPWLKTGEITVVDVALHISNIDSVRLNPKEISMTFRLHQQWIDPRLKYNASLPEYANSPVDFVTLPLHYRTQIWTPDVHIRNLISLKIDQFPIPNYFLRVYPNGTLFQSLRLTCSMVCPLVDDFPREFQSCHLKLESYSHSIKEVLLRWTKHTPVEFNEDVQMPSHELIRTNISNFTERIASGNYSCLTSTIDLRRVYSVFSILVYVPSLLLVFLSWLSFAIDRTQVPARTSLCALIVMSGVTHITGALSMLNTTAISEQVQTWLAASLVFMVISVVEFVISHNLTLRKVKRDSAPRKGEKFHDPEPDDRDVPADDTETTCRKSIIQKLRENPEKLDTVCLLIFPILFFGFNIFYWLYYLT
ncbi:hypothetical protein ScPMuIL_009005 [Solemya velum]